MDIVPEGRGRHIGREGSKIPHDSLMYLLDIIMYNFVFGSLKFQSLF